VTAPESSANTAPMRPERPAPTALAAALALAALALAGCGEGGLASGLRSVGVGTSSPDEFLVLPTRPLELPPDLNALPPPTPGRTNRVDYVPRTEAITALSGSPAAAAPPASDLVASVGPIQPGIRAILAEEDVVYRQQNQPLLFERWFRPDRDRLAYQGMLLDPNAEYDRLRARGLRVPAAPPLEPPE
jgi:hypothetical protein